MSFGHGSVQAWLCALQVSPQVWGSFLPAFPVLSRNRELCGSSSAQELVCDGDWHHLYPKTSCCSQGRMRQLFAPGIFRLPHFSRKFAVLAFEKPSKLPLWL